MKPLSKKLLVGGLSISVFLGGFFGAHIQKASAVDFFSKGITINDLVKKYSQSARVLISERDKSAKPFKILIVPGHDDENSGAIFQNTKEADLNLALSKKIANYFKEDKRFSVTLSRDDSGYLSSLEKYFDREEKEIEKFISKHKKEMKKLIRRNKIEPLENGVFHNDAPSEMVLKLYGINKWVDENNFDLVLHVHFNDHPGRQWEQEGKYSGFAIYVPEKQYSNSETSIAIANSIKKSLEQYFPVSNLPKEDAGVVEDQELIAIGAFNTLKAPSLLIEYGYLYEPQFTGSNTKDSISEELALRTYAGIKTFFEGNNTIKNTSTFLPHVWENDLEIGEKDNLDVLKLQVALLKDGVYPPEGKTLNDCTIRGEFGNCTEESVIKFQNKYDIPATGVVGPLTRAKLNELF